MGVILLMKAIHFPTHLPKSSRFSLWDEETRNKTKHSCIPPFLHPSYEKNQVVEKENGGHFMTVFGEIHNGKQLSALSQGTLTGCSGWFLLRNSLNQVCLPGCISPVCQPRASACKTITQRWRRSLSVVLSLAHTRITGSWWTRAMPRLGFRWSRVEPENWSFSHFLCDSDAQPGWGHWFSTSKRENSPTVSLEHWQRGTRASASFCVLINGDLFATVRDSTCLEYWFETWDTFSP